MTPGERVMYEAYIRKQMAGLEDKAMRAEGISPSRRRKRGKYAPLLGILFVMAFSVVLMYVGMRFILKVAP